MSLNNVELLEKSFERIKPRANEFVASFYENLFLAHPEVKPLFAKTDMANQNKKLLNSLILVVENLRNPEVLGTVLQALGARHVGYGAIAKYYPAVGKALLTTFEQYLQQDWTPQVQQAWVDAFGAITAQMLQGADYAPQSIQLDTEAISEQQVLAPSAIQTKRKIKEVPDSESLDLPIELLERTFEKIKPRANEFVASFYENLFLAHPEVKPLFAKTDMANQNKKLLNSLILVVESLRNPEVLGTVLQSLGARHVGYGAIAKYYPAVGKALLTTFEQYLQQDWTPQVQQAWVDAFGAITAQMLKGAKQDSSVKVVPDKKSELKAEIEREPRQSRADKQQQSPILALRWINQTIRRITTEIIETFWILPTWLIAIVSAVMFTVVFLFAEENSLLAEVLEGADTISLVVALVLFIKETPDRRKQFHYQAWGTIDASHNVKVSYARILALQDLNEDNVPLRGLDAPGAELVEINLPSANLSEANLSGTDFSKANLSHANFNNANLSQAKLSAANLSHTNLSFARLSQANLSSANLSNANLICADLTDANMSGANLQNANLNGANLNGAYLTGANLKNSSVSIFELSGAFLEGAIMPDGSKYKSLDDAV